ncbi:hypothetical protein [Cellulomonas sp. P5_C5]
MRRLPVGTLVLTAVLATTLAACGDSGDDASAPSGTSSSTDDGGGGQFSLTTADGRLSVTGTASTCENPDDANLTVTFTGDGATVTVAVAGGKGSLVVTGDDGFEGTISDVQIGDGGDVDASGSGAAADDSAADTRFTLTGRCP